jgi:hypothetical protein
MALHRLRAGGTGHGHKYVTPGLKPIAMGSLEVGRRSTREGAARGPVSRRLSALAHQFAPVKHRGILNPKGEAWSGYPPPIR